MASIYHGVWYDYSSQKLVLTLSTTSAGFLIAALVTWVNLVAGCTWSIWRYLLFTFGRSQDGPSDVFRRQRQAAIRNSSGAAAAATELAMLTIAWKPYHVQSLRRNAVYLLFSVAIFALWIICGLYAPLIYTRTGTDVLLALSPRCGSYANDVFSSFQSDGYNLIEADRINQVTSAQIYVQHCYNQTTTAARDSTECQQLPRQSLPFTLSPVDCPFGTAGSDCVSVNSTPMVWDTGYLDSCRDLGINAPLKDTIQYRRRAICSPLLLEPYVSSFNVSADPKRASLDASAYPSDEILFDYNYGPMESLNYTFQYSHVQSEFTLDYGLKAYFHDPTQNVQDWLPNTTFFDQPDMDLTLLFLQGNNIWYHSPTYDPCFAASNRIFSGYEDGNLTYYISNDINQALACTEQYQVCLDTSASSCTPLVAGSQILDAALELPGMRDAQLASIQRIVDVYSLTTLAQIVFLRGSDVLLASGTVFGGVQVSELPINQWVLEVSNLFSVALAFVQTSIVSYAAGPSNPLLDPLIQYPNVSSAAQQCSTQRIPNPGGVVNFDMLGLLLLFLVGAVLMTLGIFCDELTAWVSKKFPRALGVRHEDWIATGLFQIQRTALESQGIGNWVDTESRMPKTKDRVARHSTAKRALSEGSLQSVALLPVTSP